MERCPLKTLQPAALSDNLNFLGDKPRHDSISKSSGFANIFWYDVNMDSVKENDQINVQTNR